MSSKVPHHRKEIDDVFSEELLSMASRTTGDPVASMTRVQEAQSALKAFGFPPSQSNKRSALVLLSLINLKRDMAWKDASRPMLGITEMMAWFAEEYGELYAPNSRETVRRKTVHQFLDIGLITQNPDDPGRPTNSDKNVYQVIPEALRRRSSFWPPGEGYPQGAPPNPGHDGVDSGEALVAAQGWPGR